MIRLEKFPKLSCMRGCWRLHAKQPSFVILRHQECFLYLLRFMLCCESAVLGVWYQETSLIAVFSLFLRISSLAYSLLLFFGIEFNYKFGHLNPSFRLSSHSVDLWFQMPMHVSFCVSILALSAGFLHSLYKGDV